LNPGPKKASRGEGRYEYRVHTPGEIAKIVSPFSAYASEYCTVSIFSAAFEME